MPPTSTRIWTPAAYFRLPTTWPKWSKATRRSKSSPARPTTWCPATIRSCSRATRRPRPASKAGWCASMWSRRARSTASRRQGRDTQAEPRSPSRRVPGSRHDQTRTSATLSPWSLPLIRVTGVKQPPAQPTSCATLWSSPAARVEPWFGANDGSNHDDELDELDAISRQTAVGAASRRAHRRPDRKDARRDAQRGDRPVKAFARDRLPVRYRELDARQRAQGGGSQETSASAARRAAQSVARTGARRGARRARRQGHVEGAQSRGAVAANRGPFRNFPAGRLRKGQNLDRAVALLSVAWRPRSTQPPINDRIL